MKEDYLLPPKSNDFYRIQLESKIFPINSPKLNGLIKTLSNNQEQESINNLHKEKKSKRNINQQFSNNSPSFERATQLTKYGESKFPTTDGKEVVYYKYSRGGIYVEIRKELEGEHHIKLSPIIRHRIGYKEDVVLETKQKIQHFFYSFSQ